MRSPVLLVSQVQIANLICHSRVVQAAPPWLRFVCTTRRDAAVLRQFHFPLENTSLLDIFSSDNAGCREDMLAFIRSRLDPESELFSSRRRASDPTQETEA